MIATELRRTSIEDGRSVRITFALSQPYVPPRWAEDEPIREINFVTVYATYNPRGGSLTSVFESDAYGNVPVMLELADIQGECDREAQCRVLFSLDVNEIHWRRGTITINPRTGRWGEGGPGSDDYMSFGI